MKHMLSIATILLVAASPARAQAAPDVAAMGAVRHGFNEVHGWVLRAAELVPQERYGYRPVGTVRTYGQLVAHIAAAYDYYCDRAAGRNTEWVDADTTITDRAAIIGRLQRSAATCTWVLGGTPVRIDQLMANIAHTNLHYGNMVTYLRMMGLVPPSS